MDIDIRLVVAKGKGVETVELGVWNEQMQTSTYAMDKQQGPAVSTGNSIQCLVINHNRKEYEKECIHIYMYVYM